jgi:anti-sigma-K factor RskA
MTHPTELLPGYVLGDLNPLELEAVETHLLGCPNCRTEVAHLRDALFSLADALPPAAPPPQTWARIEARRTTPLPSSPHHSGFNRKVWLGVAAAVALLTLGGLTSRSVLLSQETAQQTLQRWEAQGATQRQLTTRSGEAFGTLLVRPDGQALILLDRPAPAGQVYQAWGRQASGPRAGVPVSLGLTGGAALQVAWTGFDSVGISVEPTGGSAAPTQPLGRVDLRG